MIRSGSISARGQRTRRYYRHWFILKDAALSWYPSSAVSRTLSLPDPILTLSLHRIRTSQTGISTCESLEILSLINSDPLRSTVTTAPPSKHPPSTPLTSRSRLPTRSGTLLPIARRVETIGSRLSRRSSFVVRTRARVSR